MKLSAPQAGFLGLKRDIRLASVPKTLHAQLTTRAKTEGVSLNTLVLTFIAEGMGRHGSRA